MTDDPAAAAFEEHRGLLLGAAYRLLGVHSDAEDVVQETWLRWSAVDPATVNDTRAYLLTITSRLALNRLRELKARRESYVGPWLPEPVATATSDDPAKAAELADEVSMAMLIVLESLTPLERAAFVLTDVFGMASPEVAHALGRSPASVRQLVSRARSHLAARPPRQVVEESRHRAVIERFLAAAVTGDVEGLIAVLSPDVTLVTDGGGVRRAALRPIHSVEKVIRWILGVLRNPETANVAAEIRTLNGEPAVVARGPDGVHSVYFMTVEDGRITDVHAISNPEKLGAV
ncbi:RNA polymerase sigma factor SigJ [Intrasporangium sp.]|uniref:RNA polymerase sigma factor SigJ n=1 Tax=Intrasporangium sp. TaxID=1925024 RepID=UPI00293A526F|nr:RNA polymerase sigma factor SigJ [Intrasporangium sp.]MDV3223456.1 RNA polymerase sigma factor SigJ [Intrasporangium sp.]